MVSAINDVAEPLEVTIASSGSITSAIDTKGRTLVGIFMPASWTAASITFQAAITADGTYVDVYDTAGSELSVTADAGLYLPIDPINFWGLTHIKVRSGTSGSAVSQGAERTLTLMLAKGSAA